MPMGSVSRCPLHVSYQDGCDACILWRIEAHNIVVEALDLADGMIAKYRINTA